MAKFDVVGSNYRVFKKTSERIEITMWGWDGTGYDGEGKKMNVYTCENLPGRKFVGRYMACWKEFCLLEVLEEKHPVTGLPTVGLAYNFAKANDYKF